MKELNLIEMEQVETGHGCADGAAAAVVVSSWSLILGIATGGLGFLVAGIAAGVAWYNLSNCDP